MTVETIINNYQKQNQLKPQSHNHKLSPSDRSFSTYLSNSNNPSKKSNSSSASSLLTSSNSNSTSIFEYQLASSNPRYGRHLREQSINQL
ncbi:hypothetical protein BY996DRAFT_6554254, partial [Phakopsora pachyrhizi]